MKIENEFGVDAPLERAWAALTDLEGLAPCMPGAQLTGVEGDVYKGKVKVKVGPVISQFAGTARFVEKDDAAHHAVISASGKDARGGGNASAMIHAQLRQDGSGTHVSVSTDLNISGKLAQFGSGMIKEISEKLLTQFVHNLEAQLHEAPAAGGTGPAEAPAGAGGAAGAGPVTAAPPVAESPAAPPTRTEGPATAPATPAPGPAGTAPTPTASTPSTPAWGRTSAGPAGAGSGRRRPRRSPAGRRGPWLVVRTRLPPVRVRGRRRPRRPPVVRGRWGSGQRCPPRARGPASGPWRRPLPSRVWRSRPLLWRPLTPRPPGRGPFRPRRRPNRWI